MINWLLEQSVFFVCFISILLTFTIQLRRLLGASGYYALWAIIPIQLIFSMVSLSTFYPKFVTHNVYVVTASDVVSSSSQFVMSNHVLAFYVWITGSFLVSGLILFQHVNFNSKLNAKEANNQELQVLQDLCLPFLSEIKVKICDEVDTPIARGLWKNEVLLPPSFFKLTAEEQQLILEHEIVHLRRGDLYWNSLALIILIIFWFNPLAWFSYRHFRLAQEMACDSKVLESKSLIQKQTYARTFLIHSVSKKQELTTTLNYGGKEKMKDRINNIKTGRNFHWLTIPAAFSLLFGSLTFQAIGYTQDIGSNEIVSPIKRANPIYPEYAKKKGIEGTVLINFSIEKDGGVSDIQVIESDHDGLFDASAILALKKWVYNKPARKLRNQHIAIEFALTDKPKTSQYSNVEKIQIKGG